MMFKGAGSSRASKNNEFFRKSREAKERFGEAESRPQDEDPQLMRTQRRTNHGMIAEFPDGYPTKLRQWIENLGNFNIPPAPVGPFSMDFVIMQDETNQSSSVLKSIKPPPGPGGMSVLAVDFEFHQEYTYDGFICLASVSSATTTLVVDCINANRAFAMDWLTKMLTGSKTLKVFCGCANDVFRMQKDWQCFANGVVDIQDIFVVWRQRNFGDCYNTCQRAIRNRFKEQGKQFTEDSVIHYLESLNSPGLGLLIDVFFPHEGASKDNVSSMGDWRKRPLHQDLIRYSACDSFYTLKVFYEIYGKVGIRGVQDAGLMTIAKLVNRSSLPRYKDNVIRTASGQWVVEQILKWRLHLAKHYDMKPDQVINSKFIPKLASELEGNSLTDVNEVEALLIKHRLNGYFLKGVKLLIAHLDRTGKTLEAMKTVVCHNCNTAGHCAKICFFESMPEAKRQFRERPENAEFNIRQNQRRHDNWCLKRNLDPATTVCPWETQPQQR